jgi:putative spermidine/putrescine transport system substrate-binding protein
LAGLWLAGPAPAQELTVVSWGGAYTRSQMLGFIRPFQEDTGRAVNVVSYQGGLAEIREQVRSYNVKWDVVDMELADVIRGCREGLLTPIDPEDLAPGLEGTPPGRDFMAGSLTECGVGSVVWSTVIGYDRADFADEPPQKLEAFFDVSAHPGKRGMRRTPKGNLEWALIADGVAPEAVYRVLDTEAGLERAFRVLTRIKPQIVWWESGSEAIELLRSDRVRMTTVYSGNIWQTNQETDADLAVLWDHQIRNLDLWAIPRHTQNLEQARAFVRYATTPRSLARQARHIPYGPVRHSARPLVPEAMARSLPTREDRMAGSIPLDGEWWADNFERINARFQRWADRPVQVPRDLPR